MKTQIILGVSLLMLFMSSCTVIRPGEVGIKQRLGVLSENTFNQGTVWFNPFTSKIVKTNIQLNDVELQISLSSKEGLSVLSQISILYRIEQNSVSKVLRTIGFNYNNILSNVFRSAAADVCSNYYAKDMHTGMRAEIEQAILVKMNETLKDQGLIVNAVLLKSIVLPPGLAGSIKQKLQAEQDAMRMEFILKQEKLEAERKVIKQKVQEIHKKYFQKDCQIIS